MTLKRGTALYNWLCFFASFCLYFWYYRADFLKETAWITTPQLESVYFALSLFSAGWLLDKKPAFRKTLPVFSALACTLSIIGIGIFSGLFLDILILLFHVTFAPMFITSLYHLRSTCKKGFFSSLIAILILESLVVILLGPARFEALAVYMLASLSLLLILLMRHVKPQTDEVHRLGQLKKILIAHWVIIILFIFQYLYNNQMVHAFWTAVKMQKPLFEQIPGVLTIGIGYIGFGLLLDWKDWKIVYLLSCGLSALCFLALLVPTSPEIIQLLIPASDIGSIWLGLIILMTPFVIYTHAKGYRLFALGFILSQPLFEIPDIVTKSWMDSTIGRSVTGIAVINALVLIGLFIAVLYHKEKARNVLEKQIFLESFAEKEQLCFDSYALSNREMQVAELLVQAKTRDEIGDELRLSRGTINTYCSSLYKKTGCTSQAELISKLTLKRNYENVSSGKPLN